MHLLHAIRALTFAIAVCASVTYGKQVPGQIKAEDSTGLIREKRAAPHNGTDSLCSSFKGECVCKARRWKEHSLVCMKKDCMKRLPTDKLSSAHASQIVSLLVMRQRSLTQIGADELRPLGKVRSVRLIQCQISYVAPNAFLGLNFVERLDLHRNRLTEVPRAIEYLRNLKSLNLGGNLISFIKPGAFYSNNQLKKLVLSRNLLEVMPRFFPASLVKLSVSYNKLETVGNLALLKNLEILHVESNKISEFPRVGDSIKVLNLCGNQLKRQISVGNLVNLTKLSVSNNPLIGTISLSTFRDADSRTSAGKLASLIAKNAGIGSIDANAFACLPNLQLVDLSNNNLYQFKPQWFIGNKKIRGIFLDENPWHCHCDMESSLAEIERLFGKRRRKVEKKSRRRNKHSSRNPEIFRFANDFRNVSCASSDETSVKKCTPFELLDSACERLDFSIWEVPDISPFEPIAPTVLPEIITTMMETRIPTTPFTFTEQSPVTTTTLITTAEPLTTSTTTTIITELPTTSITTVESSTISFSTTELTATTSTTTTIPPTTPTELEISTPTTTPTTPPTTAPPTTISSTTSSTRPPLPLTTQYIEEPTTRNLVIPPTIRPETPPPTAPPVTTTTATTTSTTTETIPTTKAEEWCLKDGRKCAFPFHYDGEDHYECIGFSNWCSATYEYTGDWDRCTLC